MHRRTTGLPSLRNQLAGVPPLGRPEPETFRRIDPPLAAKVKSVAQNNAATAPECLPPTPEAADGRLSKTDRKALKKKLLQERLKAEQRKASNW